MKIDISENQVGLLLIALKLAEEHFDDCDLYDEDDIEDLSDLEEQLNLIYEGDED